MSLINKMLQDLDARGSRGANAGEGEVRPVLPSERRVPPTVMLIGVLGAVALGVGGYYGLRFYQHRQVSQPVVMIIPRALPPTVIPVTPSVVSPAPQIAPVAPLAPAAAVAPDQSLSFAAPVEAPPAAATVPRQARTAPPRVRSRPAAHESVELPVASPVPAAPRAQDDERTRAGNEYRRALAALGEGRVSEATDLLEQALRLDPRHDGARQTVVGLLVESGRHDDAMRHLEAALAADARQPSMALLLARLQIERGGDGIATLMRTLPAGAGKPEYHAFLGGALARASRHREAAEQYGAALRVAPDNAVWLMGLGIALQGDGRNAEALAAYQRAAGSATLTPQLQDFVERKIVGLGR